MSDTVVFIPAWNEEENLPAVLDDLRRDLPNADVLVVDDGSTDRTAEIARGRGAEVLSLGTNRGLPIGIAAPAVATSPSARASSRVTATSPTATCRARRDSWVPPCFGVA